LAEKQATLEKTERDKCAVETELEQLYAEKLPPSSLTDIENPSSTAYELDQASRLRKTEAERDEALSVLESTKNDMEKKAIL